MSYPEIYSLPESIDPDEYIVCTYYCRTGSRDIIKALGHIAVEQSTGTWVPVPAETPEVRRKHIAKVLNWSHVPAFEPEEPDITKCIAQIAFPVSNIGNSFSTLISTIMGNISILDLKLLDVWFPKSFIKQFQGPKFGAKGVRGLLKVPKRPLLNNMIKPCTGVPPETVAKLFYEAAVGGVDVIKDDELNTDPEFCRTEERLMKCLEAGDKADSEKGEKTLYTINVTGDIGYKTDEGFTTLLERAEKLVQMGANALMINWIANGFSSLRALAEDPSINVPILPHATFLGVMIGPLGKLSDHLIFAKFPRLLGGDMQLVVSPYGKIEVSLETSLKAVQALRAPFYHIKSPIPGPSAGMYQGLVYQTLDDLGLDTMIAVGGAIHAHPLGPAAGARAFRQAIDAYIKGIPIEEAAAENKELKVALDKWGIYKGPGTGWFALREKRLT